MGGSGRAQDRVTARMRTVGKTGNGMTKVVDSTDTVIAVHAVAFAVNAG